jgi:hypothetical protein
MFSRRSQKTFVHVEKRYIMIGCQVNIRVLQSIKGFGMAQLVAAFVLFALTFTGALREKRK